MSYCEHIVNHIKVKQLSVCFFLQILLGEFCTIFFQWKELQLMWIMIELQSQSHYLIWIKDLIKINFKKHLILITKTYLLFIFSCFYEFNKNLTIYSISKDIIYIYWKNCSIFFQFYYTMRLLIVTLI